MSGVPEVVLLLIDQLHPIHHDPQQPGHRVQPHADVVPSQSVSMYGSKCMVLINSLVCGELPGVGHDGDQRGPELLHLCVAGDRVGVVEPNQVHF